jgi:hypothetical protein
LSQGNPPLADISREIVLFAVRAFPAGRQLEETLEKAFDALKQMAPKPEPGADKGNAAAAMAGVQQKAQQAQMETAVKQAEAQGQLALGQQREQQRAQYDQGKLAIEAQRLQDERAMAVTDALAEQRKEARGAV